MWAAHALGLPLLVRGESNLLRRGRGALRSIVRRLFWLPARELAYRYVFSWADGFLVIGSRNADFYRHFGVPDRKLWWSPYAVDNDRFALSPTERADARAEHREQLGIAKTAAVFVVPAKLIPRKRPLDVLEAFARVVAAGSEAHLRYLGDGPERGTVERRAAELRLAGRVHVTGFVNQRAIPRWYAVGDCVVLASDALETWGLAVNEGMAAGLAAIVSDAVGCAPDLVRPGTNGWVFPLGDVRQLAQHMTTFADCSPAARASMGERSQEIVAGFSIGRVAAAAAAALAADASDAGVKVA
jgi:glycosyltransferase involved in cell wall biosynthesis